MPYLAEVIKEKIQFDYAQIESPDFLISLPHVVERANGRICYEVCFPNQPAEKETSILLSLNEGKLSVSWKHEYLEGDIEVTEADVSDLIENFPDLGVYSKLVCSCFLAQSRTFS